LAVIATLALMAGCATSGDPLSASQPFELRGATTAPTEGWIKASSNDVPGAVVYLAPRAILGAADVERATVQKDAAGRSVLLVQFTPVGTARLTAGTRELVGRQLAAVVEGRVTNIARVTEAMTINTMALTGFASFDDATRVAHAISARR
jgi:preprotein translocase subunit SecD